MIDKVEDISSLITLEYSLSTKSSICIFTVIYSQLYTA